MNEPQEDTPKGGVEGAVVYVVPRFVQEMTPRQIAEMMNHGPVDTVEHYMVKYDNPITGVEAGGMFVRWTLANSPNEGLR